MSISVLCLFKHCTSSYPPPCCCVEVQIFSTVPLLLLYWAWANLEHCQKGAISQFFVTMAPLPDWQTRKIVKLSWLPDPSHIDTPTTASKIGMSMLHYTKFYHQLPRDVSDCLVPLIFRSSHSRQCDLHQNTDCGGSNLGSQEVPAKGSCFR